MVRLGFDAANLTLLGALLYICYLESGLMLGPDQVAEGMLFGAWLLPLLLAVDLSFGLFVFLPIYRGLKDLGEAPMRPEQALDLWRRLFKFPAQAVLISMFMWAGGTVVLAWWMVDHGALTVREVIITFPCCALLGMTTSLVYYFRARTIIRPVLQVVSFSLPPDFVPARVISIRGKLMLSVIVIMAAITLVFMTQAWLWREHGELETARATAHDRVEKIAEKIKKNEGQIPPLSPQDTVTFTLAPFVVDFEGNLVGGKGNVSAQELSFIRLNPRLLGWHDWERLSPMHAGLTGIISAIIPLPDQAPFPRDREDQGGGGLGGFSGYASPSSRWVTLRRDPLPGGLHPGVIWELKPRTMQARQDRSLSGKLFLAYVAIIVLVIILYADWLTTDITGPIKDLRRVIEKVSRDSAPGPASVESDDEIGALTSSFNRMSAILGQQMEQGSALMSAVRAAVSNLTPIVGRIVGVASDQASGASEQAVSLHQISSTSEEIAATLRVIAENAQSVEQVAGQTLSSCHAGQGQLQEVVAGMEKSMARARDVAMKMLSFQEHATRIEGILDFIRDISERTNLIALNAAIEASSVGEAGERFAIVASEMRKLAEQTMGGAKQITEIFAQLEAATASAIIATEEGEKQVNAALKITDRASESFQSIVHWAGETARSAQEIALSSNQQTTATDHLATALGEVREVASKFAEAAKTMEGSITELKRLGDELGVLMAQQPTGAIAPKSKEDSRDQ